MKGTVQRLKKDSGFGFIRAQSTDYFFHRSGCAHGTRFEDLKEGDEVEFEETESSKGPRAEDVTRT